MCLTNILVQYIVYLFNQCDWLETYPIRIGQFKTNILVDMCLTCILVKYIGYLFNKSDWLQRSPTRIGQFNQCIGRYVFNQDIG